MLSSAAGARATSPEPPLKEPEAERVRALECFGDLAHSSRRPVLLVHGTGATAAENWEWGYQRVLVKRGHSVCRVNLPDRAYGDTQRSVEYVVTAIRKIA